MEPLTGAKPISPTYLKPEVNSIWKGLPASKTLAQELVTKGTLPFKFLDAAQLLKHMLALKNVAGDGGATLIYLWYDAPGPKMAKHREEIEIFRGILAKDGVAFESLTYQDIISNLIKRLGSEHRAYLDYITERYL